MQTVIVNFIRIVNTFFIEFIVKAGHPHYSVKKLDFGTAVRSVAGFYFSFLNDQHTAILVFWETFLY